MSDELDARLLSAGRRWDDRLQTARRRAALPSIDLESWRKVIDPYSSGAWARRVSWGGLSGQSEEPDAGDLLVPQWFAELKVLRNARLSESSGLMGLNVDIPFAHALQPMAIAACKRIEPANSSAALSATASADLANGLLERLSDVASQSLSRLFTGDRALADVALARLRDGKVLGSTNDAYLRFCENLVREGLRPILVEFPVLGRLLATVTSHWTEASNELLLRLANDRSAIERVFGIPHDAPVISIASGLSDPHRHGRGVFVLTFAEETRLVYKPRPVGIEARFQEFMTTLSAELHSGPLRCLTVLECDRYGYVEYVTARAAEGPESLRRFYRNAGRVLAALHILGATDCHWENMIAVDDQLLLIDGETLFEGVPLALDDRPSEEASSAGHDIESSVLRTGMLPVWISVGPVSSIDISALGAPGSDTVPSPRPSWCFANTDDMVWGERKTIPAPPTCLPVGVGVANPLIDHGDSLVAGFEEVLTTLMDPGTRERVRVRIEAFRGAPRRVVVRPTRTYALLQREAIDPDALREMNERALRLDRLARAYIGEKEQPRTWGLLQYEIEALEDLDIPYFEGVVGSRDLFGGSELVVRDYYEREGLDEAIRRLEGLSEDECSWQVRLIRGALAAHRFEMSAPLNAPSTRPESGAGFEGHALTLDIANLIASEAIEDPNGQTTWLTVSLLADATRVQLGFVPPGLYDGRAGIAAFLYEAGQVDLADRVLRPVFDVLEDADETKLPRFARTIGTGMTGVGGLLRLFQYRRDLEDDGSAWTERSERMIGTLTDEILAGDSSSDLVSGLAGLASPVSAYHRANPTESSARVLASVGELLIDRQDDAGGWSLAPGFPPLVGLSHGASGVAVGLTEIAMALGDGRYADGAARGARFEARLFNPEARNWPDLRAGSNAVDRFGMRSWCHGSVGVALARARMLELVPSHEDALLWQTELSVAVASSIDAPSTSVDHLCCGNLGRAVAIAYAGQVARRHDWESAGHRIGEDAAAGAAGNPEHFRLLLGIEGASGLVLPGLMTGLAGIGMYLIHGPDLRWARRLLL